MSETSKRRPIASREWRASKLVAAWLARRNVSPNAISVAGMTSGILAGCLFAATGYARDYAAWYWLAGVLFVQLRLVANMLDGMVAVLADHCSPVGELYNEVPDRVSDTAIFVGLGFAAGGSVPLGFIAALAAMFTAYIRTTCVAAGASPDFRGPMAKQQRMFLVTCLGISTTVFRADRQLLHFNEWAMTPTSITLALIAAGSLMTAMRRFVASAHFLRTTPSTKK